MKWNLTAEEFAEKVNNPVYKTKIVGYSYFKNKDIFFYDLYCFIHKDFYLIQISGDKNVTLSNIYRIDNLHEVPFFNVIYDVANDKVRTINYYKLKKPHILKYNGVLGDVVKFNIFDLNINKTSHYAKAGNEVYGFIISSMPKTKCDSYEFIDSFFEHYKDYSFVRNKILTNDNYTRASLKK